MPGIYTGVPVYRVDAYTLASQWLRALGWPDTSSNRQALAAWFMSESPHSGRLITVIGNNPLNITTSGSNYRLVGTHRIAVYNSQDAGIAAFNNLIHVNNYNYPGIVRAFSSGSSGQSVINAIINSGWVTGGTGPSYWHTVNGVRSNLLQEAYNGLVGVAATDSALLSAWQKKLASIGIPTNPDYVFTQADATKILTQLYGINPTHIPADFLSAFVGKTVAATANGVNTGPVPVVNPLPAVGDAVGGVVNTLLGAVLYLAAMVAGGGMALFGLYLITKEAVATSPSTQTQEVPVFIKEA